MTKTAIPVTSFTADDFSPLRDCARDGSVDLGKYQMQVFFQSLDANMVVSSSDYIGEVALGAIDKVDADKEDLVATGLMAAGALAGASTFVFGPLAAVAAGTAGGAGFGSLVSELAKSRTCTFVICNATDGALQFDEPLIDCGIQTGYPATEVEDFVSGDLFIKDKNKIPAPIALDDDEVYYSVGLMTFSKDMELFIGVYGTCGAVSFTTDDERLSGVQFAISWLVPETGKAAFAITANLFKEYDSLQDFYDKTAGSRKSKNRSYLYTRSGKKKRAAIYASMVPNDHPSSSANPHHQTLTVWIEGR